MIIGTAGHIDHGKSALVAALTGRPMDRLAEEKRRGITVDLNFAPLQLPGGRVAGVVDVPGHEDFVRTMVAGASGIDVAMLAIAADEGPMPQTLEHLAVLEHLAIPAAIPVITKADLVEPEWLDLVVAEVSERLARSSIAFELPVPTSVRTGAGLDTLRALLGAMAERSRRRHGGDLFRLPVDRSFSMPGVGTVVTGTSWSGTIGVGDHVRLLPADVVGRVRSIETYGEELQHSLPGARTAVGLAGVRREDAARGSWLVAADAPWQSGRALDIEMRLQPDAPRPLVLRSRVRVHLGTAEIMARVHTREPIGPGELGLVRLALEDPVIARAGDRLVIRSFSPVATIGGGRVIDPLPPRRALWPAGLASASASERFAALLERRVGGIARPELPLLLGLPPIEAVEVARRSPTGRLVGDRWIRVAAMDDLAARVLSTLKSYHKVNSAERGIPLETLRHALRAPDGVVDQVVTDAAAAGRIRIADGVAALSGFVPRVPGGDAEVDRVVRILEDAALSPPSLPELERQTGRRDIDAILRLAARAGRVEAVERGRYYARPALEHFAATLAELGRDSLIAPADLRDRLGISRKFMIPLLEWADAKGLTERVGDRRRLRNAGDTANA